MSKQKQVHTAQQMPSNEALQLSGIRELTGEELFKVNGGRNVEEAGPVCGSKPDTSDDSPSSGSTSSGGSSSGSSSCSASSSEIGSSDSSSSSGSSSSYGSDSDDTGGYTDCPEAGYTDYWEGAHSGGYGNSSPSDSSSSSAGSSDSSSSSGSSSSHDSSDSSSSGSSDNDYSSSDNSNSGYSGGSWGGGNNYTFPEENQASPAADTISQPIDQPHNGQENQSFQIPQIETEQVPETPKKTQGIFKGLQERYYSIRDNVVAGITNSFRNIADAISEMCNQRVEKEQPQAIGVDDDNYKIPEQLNRQKGVIVSFDKSEQKLKVNSYRKLDNGDWQSTMVYTIDAHNNVRNELNKTRETPDITTCPLDGSEAQWYFPRQFPNGTWKLGLSRKSNSSNVEGVFIPTTAYQDVPVYGPKSQPKPIPDANGNYIATGVQPDTGYGIHFAKGTTWGCIGLKSVEDAEWFAKIIDSALLCKNGFARLRVHE